MAKKFYLPNTMWTWAFFITTIVQAALVIALEGYIFARFESSLAKGIKPSPQSQTIPTYLSLFIFGFLYQILLVWDSLRLKNTIQVIGLCFYNAGMLIYAGDQYDQIRKVIKVLTAITDHKTAHINPADSPWIKIRPFLIAVPCIIALFLFVLSFIAWKLYQEFLWDIFKAISADLRMKTRFKKYQIYIALLKFDFFFFLGFTVQFLVIVSRQSVSGGSQITTAEFVLTIAAVPITILILFLAAFFTRRENKAGSIVIMCSYVAGLAYFIFKLVRMYQPGHETQYLPVRNSLTIFAAITVLLIAATITNAVICYNNFGQGLLPYLRHSTLPSEEEKANGMTELNDVSKSGTANSKLRMTID